MDRLSQAEEDTAALDEDKSRSSTRRSQSQRTAQVSYLASREHEKEGNSGSGYPGGAQWGLPFKLMSWKLDPECHLTV